MKKEEQVFFVGLQRPVELRRIVLESSKQTISTMKRYENFKQIREQKKENIQQLKKNFHELNRLMNKFKSELPKAPLRNLHEAKQNEEPKQEVEQQPKQQKKKAVKKVKTEDLSEIQKLESELNDIESKLKKMGA